MNVTKMLIVLIIEMDIRVLVKMDSLINQLLINVVGPFVVNSQF